MLPRTLEPEVMETADDASDYDAMDHRAVNAAFVEDLLAAGLLSALPAEGEDGIQPPLDVLDVGTGTARIPIALCERVPEARVMAVDAAEEMLLLARLNVEVAGLRDAIQLDLIDAKRMPYPDGYFSAVISNSIVHHIPEPAAVLAEIVRVCRPGGSLFVRDLVRPASVSEVERLVELYAGGEVDHARALFRDSLHAALTLGEVQALVAPLGFGPETVKMTSDRHWTWTAVKPG
ncbi:MAG: class I SAM-dependent methyltransferase [Pirellulales bacterium]